MHAPRQRTQQTLHNKHVTYKPFTHKHTSMSGYNAHRHQQIGTWFHRNIRQQACTGDHFHRPPPPPGKKEAARRLFPDRRPAQFSPNLVFHLPSTLHMTGENTTCHAQTVDCRSTWVSRTAGTAKRNSSPENLPWPQTYLGPTYL